MGDFMRGLLQELSSRIFNRPLPLRREKCEITSCSRNGRYHFEFHIGQSTTKEEAITRHTSKLSISSSSSASDFKMGKRSFCSAFPWHFFCDRSLRLVQLGECSMKFRGSSSHFSRVLSSFVRSGSESVD